MNESLGHDVKLPLRNNRIRFGVKRRDGRSSNSWLVWGDRQGNFYIRARDHMEESKVSLHNSGQQHFAFTPESGHTVSDGTRFISRWRQPNYDDGSNLTPSFYLLFPTWGLGVTQDDRDAQSSVWGKHEVFVEAAARPLATIVAFTVTDPGLNVRFHPTAETPSFPIGVISHGSGKTLWVVAQHIPEGNMMDMAEQALKGAVANANTDEELKEKLTGMPDGHVLGLSATGPGPDGSRYLMLFPGQLHQNRIG